MLMVFFLCVYAGIENQTESSLKFTEVSNDNIATCKKHTHYILRIAKCEVRLMILQCGA